MEDAPVQAGTFWSPFPPVNDEIDEEWHGKEDQLQLQKRALLELSRAIHALHPDNFDGMSAMQKKLLAFAARALTDFYSGSFSKVNEQIARHGHISASTLHELRGILVLAFLANARVSDSEAKKIMRLEDERSQVRFIPHADPYTLYVGSAGPAMQAARRYATQIYTYDMMHRAFIGTMGDTSQAYDPMCMEGFIHEGCNTFVVNRYLQDLFELQDLDTDECPPPPFPTVWVSTPHSGIYFYSIETGRQVEMEGFFAMQYEFEGSPQFIINLWGVDIEEDLSMSHSATLGFRISGWAVLRAGNLEEGLQGIHETLLGKAHTPYHEAHADALTAAMRIYFHMLLYLDADLDVARDLYRSEIERVQAILDSRQVKLADGSSRRATRKEKQEAQQRLKEIGATKVHLLAPALVKGMARSTKRLAHAHNGERAQTIVRGHYRWQAYGPGKTKRKRIFIAPHFSPRLEGDVDYSALLRKKEYILE